MLQTTTTKLRVLVACECSGAVRDAFTALGHDAWSCDLEASETPGNHIQGDVRQVLLSDATHQPAAAAWDLIIAHPPCTYLSVSGLHWNKRVQGRAALTEEALAFASIFFTHSCPYIAIENPVSCISSRIRKPDQIIQPYEYGHDASKKTCLWLKNLPRLVAPTGSYVQPRIVDGNKKRWANQTDSGQNRLGPSLKRAALRSKTYKGVAEAMAAQWSAHVVSEKKKRKTPAE